MRLYELAHSRAGDKGNSSDISVIVYDLADFDFVQQHVTPERVKRHFADICQGSVERFEVPQLGALKFVLHDALGGGVTRSLNLDIHGKALSSCLLEMTLPDTDRAVPR